MSYWDGYYKAEKKAKLIRRYGYKLKYADSLGCLVNLSPRVSQGCQIALTGEETDFKELLNRLRNKVERDYPSDWFPRKTIGRFTLEFVNVEDLDYCTYLDVIDVVEKEHVKKDSHGVFTWDGKKLEFVE